MRYRIVHEEVFMNVRTYKIKVLEPQHDLVLDDLTDPSVFLFVRPCNTQRIEDRHHIVTPDDFEVLKCYTQYYDRYTNDCLSYNSLYEEYKKEQCSIKFRNFNEFLMYFEFLPEVDNNTLINTGTFSGKIVSKKRTSYTKFIYKVL